VSRPRRRDRGVIAWFAGNGVAANLLMMTLVVGGLLTIGRITLEVFPETSTDVVTVAVPYPGSTPAEVEEAICVRVEEAIQDVEGVEKITSTAAEGAGTVTIELEPGANVQKLLNDIKTRVDAIDTFPVEAEKPIIQEVIARRQVITVAVSGQADEVTLKRLGERVRDDLSAIPGITQVVLAAARPYEISIEVSEADLERHGLSFDDVARAVRRSSLELPGGSIRTPGGEILLRAAGQAERGGEFENLVLLTRPDGSRVLLGEVARVVDGFAETDQTARFNGEPAVLVKVFRVGDQSALAIAGAVEGYVAETRARMPEGIALTTWQDDTRILRDRLSLLLRNGRMGLILVFLVLALFLKLRLAGWVALGIPISFLGTLFLMPTLDVSINLISLFAFIVVLGIVVDDAIVVGENIWSHYQRGSSGLRAAIDGTREMAVPVTFAVLTSIAAFSPLLNVEGYTGKIMRVIPLVVITTLFFSLIESLLVLPSHLAHMEVEPGQESRRGIPGAWRRFQDFFTRGLARVIDRTYRPTLDFALRWRYLSVAIALTLLLVTVGWVGGGRLKFTFFPPVEADYAAAMLTMPFGTPAEVTTAAVGRMEQAALELAREIEEETGEEVVTHVLASVGEQPFRTGQARNGGGNGPTFSGGHLGEVTIELTPAEARSVTSKEIGNRWREKVGPVADAVELSYTSSIFSTGEAIHVELAGNDLTALPELAGRLKERLREYPGVFDIADSFRAGKEEVRLAITPEAEAMGLRLGDLARQVRQAFYGEEAQRIQRSRDDVRVMVRYPEGDRRSLGDLEALRIRTPEGLSVPFTTAATAQRGQGYAAIRRVNRQRVVSVTADVDPAQANANEILADLEARVLPELLAGHPGVRWSFEGTQSEQRKTMAGLGRGFVFALFAIYALLAVPFRSYLQPLIVMSAIPFGIIGAIWGHVVMGMDLAILSMFGIVALTGVVVNDSLVMVDYINRGRRGGDGSPLPEAIREAGAARFRPILLTSLTTFAGLTPLLLEKSMQAQFLIPMAVSLAFGVLFATFITLLLVPVLYRILEDVRAAGRRLFGSGRRGARAGVGGRGTGAEEEADTAILEPAALVGEDPTVGGLAG